MRLKFQIEAKEKTFIILGLTQNLGQKMNEVNFLDRSKKKNQSHSGLDPESQPNEEYG